MTNISLAQVSHASTNALTNASLSYIKDKVIVTGDRPTGKLHLGHYVGSLQNRLMLQDNNKMFIIIADTQVMNNDIKKCKEVRSNTLEVMRDYLAVGLDPNRVHFFLQSEVQELFELTNYLSNIVSLPSVMRIPTIKSENSMYNQEDKPLNMGFLNYPVSQTADIILFDGQYVPVGIDQMPILEFANDVIEKFNYIFKVQLNNRSLNNRSLFTRIEPLLSNCSKLVGIDGNAKMSKSLDNAIYLSSNEKDIEAKVKSMYTDSNHLKISDPGQVEGNVVFSFLDIFHKDKDEVESLKAHYRQGGLGDMTLKRMLMQDIKDLVLPIADKRASYSDNELKDILSSGNNYAKNQAKEKMLQIKEVIFN